MSVYLSCWVLYDRMLARRNGKVCLNSDQSCLSYTPFWFASTRCAPGWVVCTRTPPCPLTTVPVCSQRDLLAGWYSLRECDWIFTFVFTFNLMLFYLDLLFPPANFLSFLFAHVFPRSASHSELPTAEGKYLFSFYRFSVISPRPGLHKISLFWEDEIMEHTDFFSIGFLSVKILKPSWDSRMSFPSFLRENCGMYNTETTVWLKKQIFVYFLLLFNNEDENFLS